MTIREIVSGMGSVRQMKPVNALTRVWMETSAKEKRTGGSTL